MVIARGHTGTGVTYMGWDGPVISAGLVQEPRKLGSPVEQGTGQAGVSESQNMRLSFCQYLRVARTYAPVRARLYDVRGTRVA